ncbi:Unknown protein [Striga hermonthica]|uniref:Transposase MuDR plant domain-containing protein n=1 Tax=Striga hermonthica TaxID=68872 RepID=A0A9N7NHT7_STRHE|nr:Unknown protein [Striga hermonthica]
MAKRDRADTKGTPVYDEDTKFTLKFFHGGEMIESLSRYYRGGFVDYFDGVDGDMLGLIEMNDFAKQLGYEEQNIRFWHQYGHSLYRGAKILSSDSDVLDIMKFIPLNREVLIYIEHLNHPQPMQPSCLPSSLPSTLHEDEEPVLDFSFLDDINTATPQTEEHFDPIVEHNSDGHSDSDDSDVLIDSEYDMMEDDRLYEKYVDHDVEFVGLGKSSHPLKNMLGDEVSSRLEGDTLEPVNSSDELESLVGSDEDDLCMPKYPKYNPTTDSRKPALKLGLVFSTKAEAKSAIETYCFRAGKSIFFDRNDSRRLRARCKTDGCEWKAYVAPMQHGSTWQVKQRSVTCRVCGEHGHNARKHKKADQNEEQEEIPVSESQPPPATDNVFSSQSLAPTPANNNNDVEASRNRSQEKTRTTRKRKSSQLDGNGNEDQRQTVNVTQSEGVTCPVVVKGGVNYITVSNIRSALRPRNGAAPGKDKAANK